MNSPRPASNPGRNTASSGRLADVPVRHARICFAKHLGPSA